MSDQSYGYRPGRDRQNALANALSLAQQGYTTWVVEDIRDAYDHVPRQRLLDVLRVKNIPGDLIQLIGTVISDGNNKRGIAQGSSLSPLLLNSYLDHHLDKIWNNQQPEIPLLRTADNLLLICQNRQQANLAYTALENILRPTGMHLKGTAEKAIQDLSVGDIVDWLGYRISNISGEFQVNISAHVWRSLLECLEIIHEIDGTPMMIQSVISGWISQMGPMYPTVDRDWVLNRVARICRALAHEEIPTKEILLAQWRQAYARWMALSEIFKQYPLPLPLPALSSPLCGGSACHATTVRRSRRSDGEQRAPSSHFYSLQPIRVFVETFWLAASKTGGWAYRVFADRAPAKIRLGTVPRTTRNRLDLTAVVAALESIDSPATVNLWINSAYVAGGLGGRLLAWKERSWRTSRNKPICNQDLWVRLDELLATHRVTCQWTRGSADYLARECRLDAERAARTTIMGQR